MDTEDTSKGRISRASLALGFGVLALGFSAIFVRWADAPGTMTAFYRMAIGSVLMILPFVNQAKRKPIAETKRGILLAILAGMLFAGDLALWSTGIVISGAAIPTLMANTAPLWVGLGSWLIFREEQRGLFWAGLCLAFVGSVVILGQDFSNETGYRSGAVLGLAAAVFYGAYYLVTQQARTQVRTLAYFWITTTSSAICLLIINLIFRHSFIAYDTLTFLNFLGIGIIVQVFGWMAINYSQGYISAAIVSATLLAQPVLTALIAWLLLGEVFTSLQVLGGVAVVSGVFIVHRSRSGH